MSSIALYLHIPFCERRCGYCSFAISTSPNEEVWRRYYQALLRELDHWQARFEIHSVYVGGGTPTLWSLSLLEDLSKAIRSRFSIFPAAEWTIEAHPSTLIEPGGREKLAGLAQAGFNRLSIGIESFEPETLLQLGRRYGPQEVALAVEGARESGFSNINLDLILGWPWETMQDFENSLHLAASMPAQHLSLYPLAVEEKTPFERMGIQVDLDAQALEYLSAHEYLEGQGWDHYEIANYSRPGQRSRHNMTYWNYQDYLGLGMGASSKIGSMSFTNVRSLDPYLKAMETGAPAAESQEMSQEEIRRRQIILGLRIKEGIAGRVLSEMSHVPVIQQFWEQGWLISEGGRTRLTPQGWLISNQLFGAIETRAESVC